MRNKILAFCLGLFICIVCLEIFLRVIPSSPPLKEFQKKDAPFVILCLGNSFTQGSGADTPEGTYPRQLEKKLRDKHPEKNIVVVNAGLVSLNTTGLLSHLDNMISKTHPQLAILQIGSANYTNKFGFLTNQSQQTFFKKMIWGIHKRLASFKSYKLIFELIEQKKNKTSVSISEYDLRHVNFLRPRFLMPEPVRKSVEYSSRAFRGFLQKEHPVAYEMIDPKEAPGNIKTLLDYKNQANVDDQRDVYIALGNIYNYVLNNIVEALPYYKQAFIVNDDPTFYGDITTHFDMITKNNTLPVEIRNKAQQFLNEQKDKNPEAFSASLSLTQQEIDDWIKSDLKTIIKRLKNENIPLVLMTYHPMIEDDVKKLNQIIRDLSEENKLPLVPLDQKFQSLWDAGEIQKNYHWIFMGRVDNHLNTKGYGVVADSIIDVLEKERLLP